LKLVFVTHTVYPDFIGGREHHVHHLARAFSKEYDVVVLGGGRLKNPHVERRDGYKLVRLPTFSFIVSKNPLQIYRFIPQLRSYLEKEEPDLIHAFEYGAQSTCTAYAYAKTNQRCFFLTVYGYVFRNLLLKMGKAAYDRIVGRHILEGADGIFCISQTQYDEVAAITRLPIFKKTLYIQENGIICDDFLSDKKDSRGNESCDGVVKILSASRLLPRKNIVNVILALREVVERLGLKQVRLSIAGPDCGQRPSLEKLVQACGLGGFVRFMGAVPYGEIKALMEENDIFILPSLYEGLPLALLEAMACGLAVIFSKSAVGEKVIFHGRDGILVEPYDVSAIAQALAELIQNKDYRLSLGRRAMERVRKFDISVEKSRIETAYLEALSCRPRKN